MKLDSLFLVALLALGSMAAPASDSTQTIDGKVGPARADIEVVFDRYKGGLFAEYSRALKQNPRLAGKIVFDIDIAAAGHVTDCRVVSSEFSRDFESKLCARIRLMQFGTQKAPSTVRKPVDFFPAA